MLDWKSSIVNLNDIQSVVEVISWLKIDGDESSLIGVVCQVSKLERLVSLGVRF